MILDILYSLRPKQWIKNLFIFLPMIFGGRLFDGDLIFNSVVAFVLFSGLAGTVYLMNDICDYENDKKHPVKKLKPIACGRLKRKQAKTTAVVLASVIIVLSLVFDLQFAGLAAAYVLMNILYSRLLKNIVIIDVFCIGLFFWLRLAVGSVVTGIMLSHWIVIMTVLLALFLGFNKRRQEIRCLGKESLKHRSVLASYNRYFIDQMISIITSSIVVAYLLYTVDERTIAMLGHSKLIYTIPFVYYGIFRYLYLMHRLSSEGDPTRVLLKDLPLQANLLLWITVCIFVIYV